MQPITMYRYDTFYHVLPVRYHQDFVQQFDSMRKKSDISLSCCIAALTRRFLPLTETLSYQELHHDQSYGYLLKVPKPGLLPEQKLNIGIATARPDGFTCSTAWSNDMQIRISPDALLLELP